MFDVSDEIARELKVKSRYNVIGLRCRYSERVGS